MLLALGGALPALVLLAALLWSQPYSPRTRWTLAAAGAVVSALGFAAAARSAVVRPLQTLSNLLGALREEDFSFRARVPRGPDAMGDALREVNALAETLRDAAPGRPGGDGAPAEGDGGGRRGRLRVRRRAAAAPAEPRGRAAARAARRVAARPHGGRGSASGVALAGGARPVLDAGAAGRRRGASRRTAAPSARAATRTSCWC